MEDKSHDSPWFNYKDWTGFERCYDQGYLSRDMPCFYTADKSQLNRSDAVLFRGRRMGEIPLPEYRTPDQKWIFFEFEPPYKVWMYTNLTKFNGLFNLTMTYTRESDIPNLHDLNRMCIHDHAKFMQLENVNFAAKKGKVPVAWMASVCRTQSGRETYIRELKKHIPIDIYGQCGNLTCGSNRLETWSEDKCNEKLFNDTGSYKFHLAFENSLCHDYVTEKLWITQGMDAIPVVMGYIDYDRIMPRNTFIDVRDFASPKRLADYLNELDRNDTKFNELVRNKRSLSCDFLHKYMPIECRLCQTLHEKKKRTKVYHDLGRYWGSRRCIDAQRYFREAAKPLWGF